jgi:hypothetical protein
MHRPKIKPAETGCSMNVGIVGLLLGSGIQRNSEAKSFLSSCAFGPPKRSGNFSRWCFLPSKSSKFADIRFGPFTSLRIFLGHFISDLQELVTTKPT